MNLLLCIVSSILCTAGLARAQEHQFPEVSLETPEDSICPPASELEAARMEITSNVSQILQVIAAGLNPIVEEIDQNDTVTYTVPECGGSGWRRVAFLNMTDTEQSCPDSWREYSQNSVRVCGRQESDFGSCDSVQYSPDGYEYTYVCGRIIGYLSNTPDGYIFGGVSFSSINEPYVDGVSVTYSYPRQHIWTLYAGTTQGYCCGTPQGPPLSFIGQNYFCDIGPTDYPLWDDEANCPSSATCCAPHSGPWFNTTLTAPTTEDIEVRICADQGTFDEDTPLQLLEIYIM